MMDADLEQNFLGALMLMGMSENAKEVARYADMVFDDDLNFMVHKRILGAIKKRAHSGENFDIVLLADDLEREYRNNSPGFPYLGEISKNATSSASIGSYVKQIKNRSMKRKGLELARKIHETIEQSDDIKTALGSAESMIQALMDRAISGQSGFRHIGDLMNDYVAQLEYDLDHPDETSGVTTGFEGLDDLLGRKRMQRGSLVVIGARPAMGKTSYMIKLLANQVIRGNQYQSLVYSLEMPSLQLVERFVSNGTGVGYDDLLDQCNGNEADIMFAKMASYVGELNKAEIYINDTPGIRVEQIAMEAREQARKKPIDIIAVDYLTLIEAPNAERNDLRVGEVTKALKRLAKELDCVVVLLSQLSRDLEKRRDKRPVNSDLRDSGQVEQDADYIIMLYREQVYDPYTQVGSLAEAILRKNRFGNIGTVYHRFESGRWNDINQIEGERVASNVSERYGDSELI